MALRAGTLNWELGKLHSSTSVLDPLVTITTRHLESVTSHLCLDHSQIKLGKGSRSRQPLPIGHPPSSLPLQILSLRISFASIDGVSNISA